MKKQTRRTFIKNTANVTGTAMATPSLTFNMFNKNSDEDINNIVGHGDFKYKVDRQWGVQDPKKYPIGDCHKMVLSKHGLLYMTTTGKKTIYWFTINPEK